MTILTLVISNEVEQSAFKGLVGVTFSELIPFILLLTTHSSNLLLGFLGSQLSKTAEVSLVNDQMVF